MNQKIQFPVFSPEVAEKLRDYPTIAEVFEAAKDDPLLQPEGITESLNNFTERLHRKHLDELTMGAQIQTLQCSICGTGQTKDSACEHLVGVVRSSVDEWSRPAQPIRELQRTLHAGDLTPAHASYDAGIESVYFSNDLFISQEEFDAHIRQLLVGLGLAPEKVAAMRNFQFSDVRVEYDPEVVQETAHYTSPRLPPPELNPVPQGKELRHNLVREERIGVDGEPYTVTHLKLPHVKGPPSWIHPAEEAGKLPARRLHSNSSKGVIVGETLAFTFPDIVIDDADIALGSDEIEHVRSAVWQATLGTIGRSVLTEADIAGVRESIQASLAALQAGLDPQVRTHVCVERDPDDPTKVQVRVAPSYPPSHLTPFEDGAIADAAQVDISCPVTDTLLATADQEDEE